MYVIVPDMNLSHAKLFVGGCEYGLAWSSENIHAEEEGASHQKAMAE